MFGANDFDKSIIHKAVTALVQHLAEQDKKEKSTLFDHEHVLSLQFSLCKIPEKGNNKPYRINLPHSIHTNKGSFEMCLIVKDDDKKKIKSFIKENSIQSVAKVINYKKLKTHYGRFEDRRKLCSSYDMFLADDRILPLLTHALGKEFFKKKKQPVPIRAKLASLSRDIERVKTSTFYFKSTGPTISIKVANSLMDIDDIVDNIVMVIQNVVPRLSKKWKNIQALYIKSENSIALPLYNCLPEVPFKINIQPTTVESTTLEHN